MARIGGQVVMAFAFNLCAESRFGSADLQLIVESDGHPCTVKAGAKVSRGGRDLDVRYNADGYPVGGRSGCRGYHDYLPSTRITDSTSSTTSNCLVASNVLANWASLAR